MTLAELLSLAPDFNAMAPREKICLFGWHLHTHRGLEVFGAADIRACFREVGAAEPAINTYLDQMAGKRNPDVLRQRGGYRLERTIRVGLDKTYGIAPTTVAVTRLLAELPAKVPNLAERAFLDEAFKCYRVGAFRAAIVMAWNLAFDHLLRWIFADAQRLASFNAAIPRCYPKKAGATVAQVEDFEEFKESQTIEICKNAALYSDNITKIVRRHLERRNMAAHPSQVVVTQAQADDTITDLINNVVLTLK